MVEKQYSVMTNASARVLYLSYDGLTDPLGQSQILPYLCGLSSSYSFSVISFEKKKAFNSNYKLVKELCEKNNLVWIPLVYHKSPPVISTLFDLFKLKREVESLYRERSFQIIHCRSYITALIGLWMKRNFDVKFIFDMRGFWADERIDGNIWNLKNPVYKFIYNFFKRKERQFINESDHVISLTQNAKNVITSWRLNTPVSVIPCCVDLDHFDPSKIDHIEKEKLKQRLGINANDKVLLYLGSWGTWYMTSELFDFFSQFKASHPFGKFLILTGDYVDMSTFPLADDIIVCKVSRNQVPLFISISDFSVFFIKPVFSKKASSATKMAEIMAMNVPVVTNRGWGDAEEIINTAGGLLYEIGTPLLDRDLNRISKNTRKYCEENLSLKLGLKKYAQVYKSLLNDEIASL
jgi:glycosyltransferase involved in cell wall biosynthesis